MTALANVGVTVDAMRARRAKLDPAKAALTLAAIIPFLLGWVVRKTVLAVWLVASWLWVAAAEGWKTAGPEERSG